jgi:hypothetical protein
MRLAIKVRGELVRQGLENIHKEVPAVGRQRLRTRVNRIVRRMQEYPHERTGQEYTRTGTLFRRWMIKEISKTGYSIQNLTPYTHFVVGDAYGTNQAWMHKGRWQLFRDVTEEELLKLPDEILKEIMMVARREEFEVT